MSLGQPPVRLQPNLRGQDLLLIVILALISMKLHVWIVAPLMAAGAINSDVLPAHSYLILFFLTTQSLAIVAAVWLVAVLRRQMTWFELGLRPTTGTWIKRGFVFSLLAFPVTISINYVMQQVMGTTQSNPQFEILAPGGFSWPFIIGLLIVVGVIAPFTEELFFRGLFYGWLRERWGVPVAIIVSSGCFAVVHSIVPLMPVLFVLGVMLALLYEKCQSLWPVIIMHGAFNALNVILLYAAIAQGLEL